MSWNLGAGHKIKALFCLRAGVKQSFRDELPPPSSIHHNKNAQILQEMLFSTSKSKPTTNRTCKSISQKEMFSYFLLSAVDLFQEKIVMYSLFT